MIGQGIALLIDGQSGLQYTSHRFIKTYLKEAVNVVGMTAILEPEILVFNLCKARGNILLAESHISIHWDKPNLYVDIFSCKGFDVESMILWTCSEWKVIKGKYTTVARGWNWEESQLGIQEVLPLPELSRSSQP